MTRALPKRISFLVFPVLLAGLAGAAQAQSMHNFNREEAEGEPQPLVAAPVQPAAAQPMPVPAPTDLQIRMNALENLVRTLTGQVEKLQFQNNQYQQTLQRMGGDFDLRFKDIEAKQAAQETGLKALVAQQQAQPAPAAAPAPPPSTATPEKPATEETINKPVSGKESGKDSVLGTLKKEGEDKTEKPASPTSEEGAQGQYDAAFQALRQAKYDDAEAAFKSFLAHYPKHKLTENATYWLAETYYVRGKFQEAAVAFAESYEKFPKGAKAPDNLLKLSMSLGSLGNKKDACVTLGELFKKFPQASAVTRNRAEQQKKSLGCS